MDITTILILYTCGIINLYGIYKLISYRIYIKKQNIYIDKISEVITTSKSCLNKADNQKIYQNLDISGNLYNTLTQIQNLLNKFIISKK